ncbi:MAG: hypothetical protein LLF96_09720 [Eubacteriales bacterium]|nr:hypothetical protein [Eubacteriales bacterium]
MKRILIPLLVLLLLMPACAFALTGQSYAVFDSYYQEDVAFINKNDNRYLLPMVLSRSSGNGDDGRSYYELIGDVLTVTVTVDITGVIEACEIRLTAPANMTYGDSVYNDFAISGYHSYAYLMAMDAGTDPAVRYALVTDVVEGLKNNDGVYTRQLGVYTLACTRSGDAAVLSFTNNSVPGVTPVPDPGATPDPDATSAPDNENWADQAG